MTFKAFQTRAVVVTSLALLLLSCATSPNITNSSSEDAADYWYCAPGDNRSWRCAEDKQALGLSYYRFWKTTLDPVAEGLEEGFIEEDMTVQEVSEPASEEPASEDTVLVKGASLKELEGAVVVEDESAIETVEEAVESDALHSKVLQLAAYNSQEQAQSFAESVEQTLSEKPSVIQTRVKGQLYYVVVYDRLASQAEAEQLMQQVEQSFPAISPWLRSRSGFEALRVD